MDPQHGPVRYPAPGYPAAPGYPGAPGLPGYPGGPIVGPGLSVPAVPPTVRVDPVPGTTFGVAYYAVSPTVSGMAIGSMVGGIASILVATLVLCFGLAGSNAGWGALVSGAFAVLAGVLGGGALVAGLLARRQIKRATGSLSGRGMATAGVACGGSGFGLALLSFVLALLLTLGS